MSANVHFVSSEAIDPAEVHELVLSRGGGRDPLHHVPGEAALARDGACVNVSRSWCGASRGG
ncbi:hypothetical protein [Actinomadura sp. NPDC000600]|uniref:hypothetical protein n=1 Tax=Actinomadura sp. NPDC000600 TaxID=3154262 RepID=UPI0033994E47